MIAATILLEPCVLLPIERDERGIGGLIARLGVREIPLPLQGVKVRCSIAGNSCRTVVEQRFQNPLTPQSAPASLELGRGKKLDLEALNKPSPIEAIYTFPLPENGALTEMELRCGDLVVKGECKAREEARERFEEARAAGHRAALVSQERDDIYTVQVTNLPPGEEVTVRLVIIESLPSIDGAFRWRFPTTIAPRYLPGNEIGHQGQGSLPDTDRVPDASRLQPPLRLSGGTELDLEVELAMPAHDLSCSLHAVRVSLDSGNYRLAPSSKATLDRDFILSFSTGDEGDTVLRSWTDGKYTLAIVEPPLKKTPKALPRDAVFCVDISGSMEGIKLEAAKKALSAALHGLLPGDRFRLIAFDDRVEPMSADFLDLNDENLHTADRWLARLQARGGTEMLPAVKACLDGKIPAGRLRTALFITDGQAWNTQELVSAITHRRKDALFFTLGIDTAVNGALLEAMARAGRGSCELATPHDDIEELMSRFEARFGSPLVDGLSVEGGVAARDEDLVLYAGRPQTLLIEGSPKTLKVRGRMSEGEFFLEGRPAKTSNPLGVLWARERVKSLEKRIADRPFEEDAIRAEIRKVALAHGIASRETSFIAVETSRVIAGKATPVVIPNEKPADWSMPQQSIAMNAAVMPSPPPGAAPSFLSRLTSFIGGSASAPGLAAPPPSPRPAPSAPPGGALYSSMGQPPAAPSKARKRSQESDLDSFSSGPYGGGDPFGGGSSDPFGGPPGAGFGGAGDPFGAQSACDEFSIDAMAEGGGDPFGVPRVEVPKLGESARDNEGEYCNEAFELVEEDKDAVRAAANRAAAIADIGRIPRRDSKAKAKKDETLDLQSLASQLARSQKADGSFRGDLNATVAALLALLLLGHTRRKGTRQRTVTKIALWLEAQPASAIRDEALKVLASAEAGSAVSAQESWWAIAASAPGLEGKALSQALNQA